MPRFHIRNKPVGDDAPVYFVAELSANHGQSLDKALKTVEAAAKAGADAIKLQTYTPDTLTLKSDAPPFVVKTKNVWAGRTLHDLYAEAMTPWEWHKTLIDAAAAHGLACFSTPFDATAVQYLGDLDVPAYKIASFELQDLPLIEAVAQMGKPVIISTGMATLADIEAALAVCFEAGNRDVALLRCVSAYPASPESMDLRSFEMLKNFGVVVGLSDHTRDSVAALTSVALGARFIEKHFIVDRSWGGPDSFFSLEPDEFKAMVTSVRTCEAALGKPRFGPGPEELPSLVFRRSLFVARDVPAGKVLTNDDVRSVRPSNGIAPRHLPQVLGHVATRALKAAEPLSWDMVGPEAPVDPAAQWEHIAGKEPEWVATVRGSVALQLFVTVTGGRAAVKVTTSSAPKADVLAALRGLAPFARAQGVKAITATLSSAELGAAFVDGGFYGLSKQRTHWVCERRLVEFFP